MKWRDNEWEELSQEEYAKIGRLVHDLIDKHGAISIFNYHPVVDYGKMETIDGYLVRDLIDDKSLGDGYSVLEALENSVKEKDE